MKIGFLGYGEAARAFHEGLSGQGLEFIAYDILLSRGDESMRQAMRARGAEISETSEGLVAADWIFSAVTADQSLAAIEPLIPHLRQGQVVVDINSVSPERKRQTAAAVEAAGADYLDMAVMAPVHPRKHATPVLLAGAIAQHLLPELRKLGFSAKVAGSSAGAATAIKMVRSLFVKGLEAITVETLLAARASGCYDEILASLSASFPGLEWSRFADYQFERTTRHGRRRAAEMRESAATLDALGLRGGVAIEIAEIQERMGACGVGSQANLDEVVARALELRLKSG
ncbi:NAD(P)-dependent oxidoreductase [Aquamicrobium sp. LC103]|uniref:NAD(P)-dependent oxidoreductase n=1 Tax=Aquamicrobium sp. LC103 TaxID=1120658 RepID=UPI00063E81DE|nr:NAD(P)-dependent oxidoreductase [Aquamicrobium sp. LC103]TKT74597.1 NAD(P)-dependent oxidoreductase [Aquamicrobium sp. LC103]